MTSLDAFKEKIEIALDLQIVPKKGTISSLYEGARYSLLAPGKRIRPLLVLSATEMLNGNIEAALTPACALEIIHTYSLIHDDLPCMDNDDFRRGKPTLHRVYNEGHAVLVGDYLLTFSFELLANAPHLSSGQKLKLIQILSHSAGGDGMIGGQVMDLAHEKDIKELHAKKTGALFCAALQFGAIISMASSQQFDQLSLFGRQFGYLFQLIDDILDYDHPSGEENAIISAKETYEECLQTLSHFSNSSNLHQLVQQLISYLPNAVF